MVSLKTLCLLLVIICSDKVYSIQSPCPNVFQYIYDDDGILFGVISAPVPEDHGNVIELTVKFMVAQHVKGSRGDIDLLDSKEEVFEKLRNEEPLLFMLKFPSFTNNRTPKISKILVNGNQICTGNSRFGENVDFATITLIDRLTLITDGDDRLFSTSNSRGPRRRNRPNGSHRPSGSNSQNSRKFANFPDFSHFSDFSDISDFSDFKDSRDFTVKDSRDFTDFPSFLDFLHSTDSPNVANPPRPNRPNGSHRPSGSNLRNSRISVNFPDFSDSSDFSDFSDFKDSRDFTVKDSRDFTDFPSILDFLQSTDSPNVANPPRPNRPNGSHRPSGSNSRNSRISSVNFPDFSDSSDFSDFSDFKDSRDFTVKDSRDFTVKDFRDFTVKDFRDFTDFPSFSDFLHSTESTNPPNVPDTPNENNKLHRLTKFDPPVNNEPRPVEVPQTTAASKPSTTGFSQSQLVCGLVDNAISLIFNGEIAKKSDYPWLGALFKIASQEPTFLCGSTLVTKKHALTGRENIQYWLSEGSQTLSVSNTFVHEDFADRIIKGDGDIGVLVLSEEVKLTAYVKPICIGNTGDTLIGKEGTVVGWGKTEKGNFPTTPLQVTSIPVVKYEECIKSNPAFSSIASERTFCAGHRNNSGPCLGDSGSGFCVKENGRWTLRGIVSHALMANDMCDLTNYVVFVDVDKYREWILTKIMN